VIIRAVNALTQGLNVLGSVLIMALIILVGVDVVGRNFFAAPVSGVPEIVTLSIVAIVFLQVPQSLRENRIPRSDGIASLIARRLPRLSLALETLFDLAGIAVMAVIVWTTWPLLVKAWQRNDFIGAIGEFTAPTWPIKSIIMIGGTVLIMQFILRIYRRFSA
jgi:TRAP-type mannitol/chloroaromatic compound transport system permease small subunit